MAYLTKFRWFVVLVASLTGLTLAGPAEARRIIIDNDTFENWGDASNGAVITLSHPVNYGAGLQTNVMLGIANVFIPEGGTTDVSLTFTGSPSDVLLATLVSNWDDRSSLPSLYLGNDERGPIAGHPPAEVSNFQFGMAIVGSFVPCCALPGTQVNIYSPYTGLAQFLFTDLSPSGTIGDFGLTLFCGNACQSIGFNLNGLAFSSNLFDPAALPTQLVSYDLGEGGASFYFEFRNPAAVPEPGTWAMMLIGFGGIGYSMRKARRVKAIPQVA